MRSLRAFIETVQNSICRLTRLNGDAGFGGTCACSIYVLLRTMGATRPFTSKIMTRAFPLISTTTIFPPQIQMLRRKGAKLPTWTFCLLRFEVAVAIRKLNYHGPIGSQETPLSTEEKRPLCRGD